MISYAAYLRVYEPLAAFEEDERARWAEYAASGTAPSRADGVQAEHAAGLAALLSVPPRPAPATNREQAFVRQEDGLTYVCPWRTALRSWIALADFRRGLPAEIADAFVPPSVAEQAEADLARWQADHPEDRPSILCSTWQVPLPWFLLFEPAERHLVLGKRRTTQPSAGPQGAAPGGAQTGVEREVLYVTAMARARQRVARALFVLRRVFDDGPAVVGVEDLGRWLEEFHPHSLVELDYGGLVHLVDDEELEGDDSVGALGQALARLAAGDAVEAQGRYEEVVRRWRRIAALEAAN